MLHIHALIADGKGVETVRTIRWPDGVQGPTCDRAEVTKQGRDEPPPERQRSRCQSGERRFDDWTDTSVAGPHQPLRVWIVGLYCRGRNLAHQPIAQARALNASDGQQMTCPLRPGLVAQPSTATLSGEVAGDEVSLVAGHQGKPDDVANTGEGDGADDSRARADGARAQRSRHRASG